MNAVVALCHFCETHGPRIVQTCQAYRQTDLPEHSYEHELCCALADSFPAGSAEELPVGSPDSNSSGCSGFAMKKSDKVPRFYGDLAALLEDVERLEQVQQECSRCAACSSVGGTKPGFLMNDHAARISFVGSQQPYQAEILNKVKHACLRSLSCEVCPGIEGVVFFGDGAHGFTLSHTFLLRDAKARGFQQLYSILIVSNDKLLLLNQYDFLVGALKDIVEQLKTKSAQVFNREQLEQSGEQRLSAVGRAGMLPTGFLRVRVGSGGSTASARRLDQLTDDQHVFLWLHRYFVWLMKSGVLRIVERQLEGPPTQDSLVEMERRQLNDTTHLESEDIPLNGQLAVATKQCSTNDIKFDANTSPSSTSKGSDAPAQFYLTSTASVDSERDEFMLLSPFRFLQLLSQKLSRGELRELLNRLLIGDQIIVCWTFDEKQPLPLNLGRVALTALAALLPLGCVRCVYSSSVYLEPYVCNLLGVDSATATALEPADTDAIILQLTSVENADDDTGLGVFEPNFTARLTHPAAASASEPAASMTPTLVTRYSQLVTDVGVPANVLEKIITSAKELWLGKVKKYYMVTKEQQGASFGERDGDVGELLKVLKCTQSDLPVVKFWQSGLSRTLKTQVFERRQRQRKVS